jgi:hypothetical protein
MDLVASLVDTFHIEGKSHLYTNVFILQGGDAWNNLRLGVEDENVFDEFCSCGGDMQSRVFDCGDTHTYSSSALGFVGLDQVQDFDDCNKPMLGLLQRNLAGTIVCIKSQFIERQKSLVERSEAAWK